MSFVVLRESFLDTNTPFSTGHPDVGHLGFLLLFCCCDMCRVHTVDAGSTVGAEDTVGTGSTVSTENIVVQWTKQMQGGSKETVQKYSAL